MAFGSKEGTRVYFSFPSKAPAKEPLQIPFLDLPQRESLHP
jgi:hypothetical protein